MHTNWNWIKQRPQFIAEELSKKYNVFVYYPSSFKKQKLCKNNHTGISVKPFLRIPFSGSNKFFRFLNSIVNRVFFSFLIRKHKINVLWLCSPSLISLVPKHFKKNIVYDCMDDYYAMSMKESIMQDEKIIVNKASIIFASSESLIQKLICRHNANPSIIKLVRNGHSFVDLEKDFCLKRPNDGKLHICYMGTISEWFDFETLEYACNKTEGVVFDLIGPYNEKIKEEHQNNKILFYGKINHSELCNVAENVDCFMMPFKINDIIRSVDPVKMYEYIYFNKNIISCKYDEIERFSDFVFFYEGKENFVKIIQNLQINNNIKFTESNRKEFLRKNSWKERANLLSAFLETTFENE